MVSSITTRATTWEIEVGGGGGNGTPYFAPQNLSIMQDDVVEWNWVSGIHNVLSMSGPVSFASDTHFAPHTYAFEFSTPGTYDYICSYAQHSTTQFGTITVTPLTVLNAETEEVFDFVVSPNPAVEVIRLSKTIAGSVSVRIFDLTGKIIYNGWHSDMNVLIDCNQFARGICLVEMSSKDKILTKRLSLL